MISVIDEKDLINVKMTTAEIQCLVKAAALRYSNCAGPAKTVDEIALYMREWLAERGIKNWEKQTRIVLYKKDEA